MRCPVCHFENRADALFCQECGAQLDRVCASCHASVSPDQKFCHACGRKLIEKAPAGTTTAPVFTPEAYTPKHLAERILGSRSAIEGERKQVTVLFADIKGSLELIQRRDPEETHKILDAAIAAMLAAVHRYDGTVNKVMGDGVMALFGAPIAHEDHAVRACYAALAMQRGIETYAAEAQLQHGVRIQARVGLHSGEVVVRAIRNDLSMDYDAIGQTVHLASRMEQLAAPGGICLTADTLRLAEGLVEVTPLGPTAIKGIVEPIEVFGLIGVATVSSRLQAAVMRGLTRFVGREREMEALRHGLEEAGRGHGQIIAVVGEAGVGKSRLFLEFTRSLTAHGWLLLATRAVPDKGSAWLPVMNLLKGYFDVDAQDDRRRIAEKIANKLRALDVALEPILSALLGLFNVPVEDPAWQALDPPQRRRRTLNAIKTLFARQSDVQPLVLVVEDLHAIDEETQALLDVLVESLLVRRLLLLVSYRPEFKHNWGSRTYCTQLHINLLDEGSADELLTVLLGEDPGLWHLKRRLIARARGNPLFLEESVRGLVEDGTLVGERGAYRLARESGEIEIPATVQAIIAARVDRLAPEDKDLLQAAAVVGEVVPLTVLQAVTGIAEEELQRGLENLQAAELLYEARLFPDLEYAFKHGLMHQVTYSSLLQARRKALHARVAEAMESLYADRLNEVAEALAGHCEQGEVWGSAVRYFLMAAERAKQQYTYPRAAALARRSLAAADKVGGMAGERVVALVLLGDLASLMGDLEDANRAYHNALALETDGYERQRIANRRHLPRFAARDGAKVAFYEHGGGEQTIVLVTGLIYGLATLQPIIERLCQEFRILTIELRGSGASDRLPEGGYSLAHHMADVQTVIEAAGAAPVVGVGASRGGNLLLKLAVAAPHLVSKLVMVGSALDDMGPEGHTPLPAEFRAKIREALQDGDRERAIRIFVPSVLSEPGLDDCAEQFVQGYLRLPPGSLESFFSPDPEVNVIDLLGQVRCPTLVMHGTEDRRVPMAVARYLVDRMPGAQLYAFEGKGHLPAFTATSEFCEVLRYFVQTGAVPLQNR